MEFLNGITKPVPIPNEIPIMPLRNTVVFPYQIIPLLIGREKSIKLIEDAIESKKVIGLFTQKKGDIEEPTFADLYQYGTAGAILKLLKIPDGSKHVIVQGISRIKINDFVESEPYLKARITQLEENIDNDVTIDALMLNLKNLVQKAIELSPYLSSELGIYILNTDNPNRLSDLVASFLNASTEEKQGILETIDIRNRLEKVTYLLNKELQIMELGKKIQSQIQGEIDKTQKDFYLREQLKAIHRELGEDDEQTSEIKELKKKIEKSKMPEDVRKIAEKELNRLSKMPAAAGEYTVSRTYLDWLIEIPWGINTKDNLDITEAQKILDEDHYGLDMVKKRILEYLAVRKLKNDMKGPILCFVGPPGVGKTSLGRSIARALGRNFVRMSLGGVRDEAEIRGHRRTYIGALPGRIVQSIKRAESMNPVFMLDEIDKVGMDFRGDPSSALLEVLDPEQNFSFSDHYLDISFDLSQVMFIATANLIDPIIPALKDRMEIIELPGYTVEEKLKIAQKFLIPKQLKGHGLKEDEIRFTDSALKLIISSYTKEAGVRNLEREIASILRGIAKGKAQNNNIKTIVKTSDVEKYLGPIKFYMDVAERTSKTGVATGLAWTPVGGDILFIESTFMKGKGNLSLTGHLGDVMKESAQTALSFIRSKSKNYEIDEEFFSKNDIHIHVPSGAIPKDGPSAGIPIFISLYSLLKGKKVRHDIAMTGEITLRGIVLPVGGIKEKVLAAKQAGIYDIILPEKNKKDLKEIPKEIRKNLMFHFVKDMDDVLPIAIVKDSVASIAV